jgi:hypothetical protein
MKRVFRTSFLLLSLALLLAPGLALPAATADHGQGALAPDWMRLYQYPGQAS